MQQIIDFFNQCVAVIGALLQFGRNILEGSLKLIAMIPSTASMLISVIGYLPSILITFAVLSVTISVIYLVVGRGRVN